MYQASLVVSLCILIYACGKDDDPEPEPVSLPTITSFSPTSGAIGTQVTITGTNFGTTAASNVVKFGTVTATVTTASATSLVTTVPVGATTGKISVTANKKTATSTTDYTVTKEGEEAFTIALDNTTLTLYPYPLYKATLKVTTAIGDKTTTWTSSDKTIATVSADGVVAPLTVGSVTITATVGTATANCVVTIKDGPVTKLELDNTTLKMLKNNVKALKIATLEAEVAQTSPVVWSSSDEAIATVDDQGNVTAISVGEAIITATVDNATAVCTVTVNDNSGVYVAGYQKTNEGVFVATLWKNGVPQALTDGTKNAEANSVYVDGNNVYVVGYYTFVDKRLAVLWKNGEATVLSSGLGNADAKSVVVYNGVAYVAGNEMINGSNQAMLWKDDGSAAVSLPTQDYIAESYASSVEVDNNGNIQIGGYTKHEGNYFGIIHWKNEEIESFLNQPARPGKVYSIAFDVVNYFTGYKFDDVANRDRAGFWENGLNNINYTNVSNGANNAYGQSICITSDINYIAGYETIGGKSVATVWEYNNLNNNISTQRLTDGTTSAGAYSIYRKSENFIYMTGYEIVGGNFRAKLWQYNGADSGYTEIDLSLSNGSIESFGRSVFYF
tara:strand:+ start:870 stop:2714 length:1845 start_codon:yes stop_codon:yes gene_type:complete